MIRITTLVAFTILWLAHAQAQSNIKYINGQYDGKHDAQGMRVGFAVAHLDDGSTYKGNWDANMRNGQGCLFPATRPSRSPSACALPPAPRRRTPG